MSDPQKTNALAIVALVLSITMCVPVLPLLGLILGVVALKKINRGQGAGKGLAIAAIVVGALTTSMTAAVGLPAFMSYLRRAQTSEAEDRLSEIFRTTVSYSMRVSADDESLTGRLPASTPITPARSCCDSPGGRCQPLPEDWNHPSWQALGFAMSEPHYYRYQLESDGASFTARAVGDLDCDGIYSTFERAGLVTSDGNIQGSRGIFRYLATE